ncbi:CBD9-like protein [Podospora didyma]|uniref:CBD9-like protein n=1 Tax=Podospora didyma TaxID=330526 RepID=A0AAE0N5Z4_9PEZI|nr:CBD9-like protein [Podospora didyma]
MFWNLWLGLAALLSLAAAADTAIYQDADTGLTFSTAFALYKSDGRGITFRVAIPSSATNYAKYDAVIQVVVPNDVGWAGLAWGGSMTRNPLLAAWRGSNNQVVTTSRWATSHSLPTVYNDSKYTVYKTGTKSNSTHWQFTALCTGCTSWTDSGSARYLNPKGGNRLAFAYSPNKPSNPSSNTSSFPVHDVHGYWSHDFNAGSNTNFETAVARLQV